MDCEGQLTHIPCDNKIKMEWLQAMNSGFREINEARKPLKLLH